MQKLIPYGRQTIDAQDIRAVVKVLKSDFLTQGPTIERFEKAVASYCGVKYAVAFSSGTAALHGACFAAGITQGDEVITTPMTFAASANCVFYCGGTPIFADIRKDLPLIDVGEIAKKITRHTKVLIPVDYSGIPADYDEINVLARKYELIVIADSAHSLGATYKGKKVGTLADMTMFSFHPVKVITTGEGGMIVTNNKLFYEKMLMFRTHGITKNRDYLKNKNPGSWYYEMQELGFNYRLTDIQAALGTSQLIKIEQFIRKRKHIADYYSRAFANLKQISMVNVTSDRESAWHLFPIYLKLTQLKKRKIEIVKAFHQVHIRVQVHYIPVHIHPFYRKHLRSQVVKPNRAEDYYQGEISLPIYPKLAKKEAEYVVKQTYKIIRRFSDK
ncbi:UDP-4-amino-4,6-dideoxy-N-acetyl-beta-L-altrosamine transaminase [Candidatus Microgenomates bacterium]|nr:MAG: UDP-4-amino-4,6-dideoxy-N-acetyl-beta-L-altrosamine transaminase [Candidatus Microgenomates bacterium]